MKKIMILTSKFLPNPSANGINTKYVIDELKKRSFEVSCISVKGNGEDDFQIIDGTKIYRISPSSYSRVLEAESKGSANKVYFLVRKVLRKIKLLLLLPIFPNFDPKQSREVFNKLDELYCRDKYDCIIGIFKPYSNIAALKKFKKKYPDVICIGYYLDLINSMQKPKMMPCFFYDRLVRRENKVSTKVFNANLVAIAGKQQFSEIKEKKISEKIYYVDFPTFRLNNSIMRKNVKSKDKIVIAYAGTLSTKYRNPEVLLDCLSKASENTGQIELNIFGTNDCNNLFLKYKNNKKFNITNHGFCSHEVVLEAIYNSDFLINISNKIQDAVPSKIFELFSTGKPIINLVFDKKDITTPYFEKYPSVISINTWEALNPQVEKLIHFLSKSQAENLDLDCLKEKYRLNTPDYTVDIILKILESKAEMPNRNSILK